jgi:hypothetical protein
LRVESAIPFSSRARKYAHPILCRHRVAAVGIVEPLTHELRAKARKSRSRLEGIVRLICSVASLFPICRTVAFAGARAWRTYLSRQVSDHEGQFGERVGETSCRPDIGPEVEEASAEVLDEGVPGDDHPRGLVTLQPSHRSKAGLETAVVGLERIVRVDLRVVEGRREQLIEDARVGSVPVGGDLGG